MTELITSISQVGFSVALAAFLMWRDYQREIQNRENAEETETFIREKLMTQLSDTTAALERNSNVVQNFEKVCHKLESMLES